MAALLQRWAVCTLSCPAIALVSRDSAEVYLLSVLFRSGRPSPRLAARVLPHQLRQPAAGDDPARAKAARAALQLAQVLLQVIPLAHRQRQQQQQQLRSAAARRQQEQTSHTSTLRRLVLSCRQTATRAMATVKPGSSLKTLSGNTSWPW